MIKKKKTIVCGSRGKFIGKYNGSNTWHRIPARSELEARAKMLKGTRYLYGEVSVKRYKPRKIKRRIRKNAGL
jgi:hypothetical protein